MLGYRLQKTPDAYLSEHKIVKVILTILSIPVVFVLGFFLLYLFAYCVTQVSYIFPLLPESPFFPRGQSVLDCVATYFTVVVLSVFGLFFR